MYNDELPPTTNPNHVGGVPEREPSTLSRDAMMGATDPLVIRQMMGDCKSCGRLFPIPSDSEFDGYCWRCA